MLCLFGLAESTWYMDTSATSHMKSDPGILFVFFLRSSHPKHVVVGENQFPFLHHLPSPPDSTLISFPPLSHPFPRSSNFSTFTLAARCHDLLYIYHQLTIMWEKHNVVSHILSFTVIFLIPSVCVFHC